MEITKQVSEQTIAILQKYIDKVSKINDYLELEEIIVDMLEDLRCNSTFTLINGEKMLVIEIVKNLIEQNKEFKNYKLNYDILMWIVREFHNSYFNYNNFEQGVKCAMEYTRKHYEK